MTTVISPVSVSTAAAAVNVICGDSGSPSVAHSPLASRERRLGRSHALVDDSLLAFGELLKCLIRESFHLGGQVVNGAASLALHLTLEPGYRHRAGLNSRVRVLCLLL